jgi:hypothetical protein
VRAAEPGGFDAALWARFDQIAGSLVGDDGASLLDLALVAEEVGRAAAPIPFVSDVVARRVLWDAGVDAPPGPLTVALAEGSPQLVPDGAVATHVVSGGGELHASAGSVRPVRAQGSTPLAWWEPGSPVQPDARAVREWKLLTAAALVGLTETALGQAVEFVRERYTLGVPVGALQGVAFPLVDVATAVASGRHLVWRAAWFDDHEPGARPELVPMAYVHACRTATAGTTAAAHFHGGLGFTLEADVGLYFLRAKGWSLAGGDPERDLVEIGTRVLERT